MDFRSASQFASLGGIEQLGGEAEHARRDWPAFFLIAVEQSVGRTRGNCAQLPAEIIGILDTGIETLAAGRG
jgi:hypothetical protein